MVEFNLYKGPCFEDTSTVFIFTFTTKYRLNNQNCKCVQFPLSVAYAITIHKFQGLKLSKVALNLEQKDFSARFDVGQHHKGIVTCYLKRLLITNVLRLGYVTIKTGRLIIRLELDNISMRRIGLFLNSDRNKLRCS
jgi:hypothetical protein